MIDIGYLAGYAQLPQDHMQTLVNAPTPDLVTAFLASITAKAQDHDRLQSENLRLSVELENAVRGSEARARALKGNADKALEEVESLRQKLNEEGTISFANVVSDTNPLIENARRHIEGELQSLQASTSTSTNEVGGLQAQVSRLEKSNRDTLSLYESKSKAHDQLAEEISTQHEKVVTLRKQVTTLEEKNMSTENTLSSLKFRESNLQQEITNLKRNNDYFDSELKTKTTEFGKYRRDKTAKIAELQRANEDANANVASLQRAEMALQKRIGEVEQKADDAFAKTQRLQEDTNRMEQAFRAELQNAKRLTELQKQAADTNKKRVQELDAQLEQIRDDAADEVANLQTELDNERYSKESTERKVEELELRLENLQAAPPVLEAPSTPAAASPRPGSSVFAATPGSARVRGGLSLTQVFSELQTTLKALDKEKRRNEQLSTALDELIKNLEKKEPEMLELQEEHAFARAEAARLSDALGKIGQEKEAARKESRRWESEARGNSQEADLLRAQLRDLSAQLKCVLVNAQLKDEGHTLTDEHREQLERAARSYLDDTALAGMTDTAAFITQNLVAFRTVFEMQAQNEQLLRLTRQLGEQMEGEEALAKKQDQEAQARELESLRSKCERLTDEIKICITNSESFVKERDMFRRMLSHRGRLPPDGDLQSMFGQSINGAGSPSASQMGDTGELSKQLSDHVKMLKEMQSQYDAFRKEVVNDQSSTRLQLDHLTKDKHELQNEKARLSSQLELAKERFEMLQNNMKFLQQEKEASQQRQNALAESAAKQDIRTQQVAEELVETKELSESLRNENSNLKMEKELWRRIEVRLTEDNQSLLEEKSRLNKSVADIQSLSNERERSETELRRRIQTEKDSLESELREAKRKLENEIEEGKRTVLRRDFEQDQSRARVEDLSKSLSNAKEELASVKTARDQLQARSEELKIELRSAEERAQALRPLPTPRPASTSTSEDPNALSREQELGVELADIRKELELTKTELENVRGQVEQYKAIAQSAEEELQSFNDTQDQYRDEMEKAISDRDTKIKDLEQRVEDISSELSESNNQMFELRAEANDSSARLEQQKTGYEVELARVKDESERYQETAKFHQEDLKAQAQIAQQAQQSYENELVKHAEAAKQLQDVRTKYNEIKLEVSQSKADAEAARVTLTQNEDSWASIKEQYERELTEMRRRRDDVDQQNKILHQQLENVSKQILALKQSRLPGQENGGSLSGATDLQGLQEVINYLRQEKEIVNAQYELSQQEVGRLTQTLNRTQAQLDETRLKLEQDQQRQADASQTSINHSKLVDTINELNVFRESSVTLRNEARQAQTQLAEKSKEVEKLLGELEPLQEAKRTLENEKETLQGEFSLLKEDRDRWQTRAQSILQKYDRIDPEELEGYKRKIATLESSLGELEAHKEKISTLEREHSETSTEKQTLQDRVDALTTELEGKEKDVNDRIQRLREQFKARNAEQNSRLANKEKERLAVEEELNKARSELAGAITARDEAIAKAQSQQPDPDTQMQNGIEEGQVEEEDQQPESAATAAQQARLTELEAALASNTSELDSLRENAAAAQNRVAELEGQLAAAQTEIEQLRTTTEPVAQEQPSTDSQEHFEKLKEDLTAAQQELEALRSAQEEKAHPENGTSSTPQAEDTTAQLSTEQIAQQVEAQVAVVRAELEATYAEKQKQSDESLKIRSEKLKTKANEMVRSKTTEFEAAKAQLVEEHSAAITQLKEVHLQELESLRSELASLQQAKVESTPSNPAATAAPAETAEPGTINIEGYPEMTREQAQSLVQNNETFKGMVRNTVNNVMNQRLQLVNEEHEKKLAEINATHEKEMADKAAAFQEAKNKAIALEQRKAAAKKTAIDVRMKQLNGKLGVVEASVNDTPQKPVVEVWEEVKTWGMPKPAAADTNAPAAAPPQTPIKTTDSEAGAVTSGTGQTPAPEVASTTPAGPVPSASSASQAEAAPEAAAAEATAEEARPLSKPPSRPASRAGSEARDMGSGQRGGHHAGTGPAALRGLMQGSGIPRGGGPAGRGGAQSGSRIPSFGQSRGGQQSGIPRGGGNAPSGRGGFNPGASTFQPGGGVKRPREEAGAGAGNNRGGKRARGNSDS